MQVTITKEDRSYVVTFNGVERGFRKLLLAMNYAHGILSAHDATGE